MIIKYNIEIYESSHIYSKRNYNLYFFKMFITYGVYLRAFDLLALSEDFQPQDCLGLATYLCRRNWNLIDQNLSLVSVKDVHTFLVSMDTSPFLSYLTSTSSWMKMYLVLFISKYQYIFLEYYYCQWNSRVNILHRYWTNHII